VVLGKVVGTVVSTRKEDELSGLKFLLVKACDPDGRPNGSTVVAVDAVGAGVGEVVLYASGSSARQTTVTKDRPVDATIMAIVDEVELDGETRYVKGRRAEQSEARCSEQA
jgi:microcompartment protein CcmK/EutM